MMSTITITNGFVTDAPASRYAAAGQILAGKASDDEPSGSGGLAVEAERPKLKEPTLYKVLLLNDDYTPMEFVVEVLEKFFSLGRSKATQVMLEVHTKGKGVCGLYTAEIAETKVSQVNDYARSNQHPLLCSMEAD